MADLATELSRQIQETLGSDRQQPFVKGKATIYLFQRRYDLNELGLMLLGTDLPRKQTGRWVHTPADVFAAQLLPIGQRPCTIAADLARQLAAIHLTSWADDMPHWFADGMGYLTAARIVGKDPKVDSRQKEAKAAFVSQDQPFAFATGQLNQLDAGLAAHTYLRHLQRKNQLQRLLKSIRQSRSFNTAFINVFDATPQDAFRGSEPRRRR